MADQEDDLIRKELWQSLERERADLENHLAKRSWVIGVAVAIASFGGCNYLMKQYESYDPEENAYYGSMPGILQWALLIIIGCVIYGIVHQVSRMNDRDREALSLRQESSRKAYFKE